MPNNVDSPLPFKVESDTPHASSCVSFTYDNVLYHTLTIGENTCAVTLKLESNSVTWYFDKKTRKPTGQYKSYRKDPAFADTAILHWREPTQ